MDQLELAEAIAREAHENQKRYDGSPYIAHLERVVDSLYTYDAKVVGWLHDVMEDTTIGSEQLLDRGMQFGYVSCLLRLSHEKGTLYNHYIEGMIGDDLAITVKIADIIDNVSDTPTPKQKQKYKDALTILALNGGING